MTTNSEFGRPHNFLLHQIAPEILLLTNQQLSTRNLRFVSTVKKVTTETMNEGALEPSHFRPPLEFPTTNCFNQTSHRDVQQNEMSKGIGQQFDVTFFPPSFVSYTWSCYYFFDIKKLCAMLTCACVILDHPANSPSTFSSCIVRSSTGPYPITPYPTKQYTSTVPYSTKCNLPFPSNSI